MRTQEGRRRLAEDHKIRGILACYALARRAPGACISDAESADVQSKPTKRDDFTPDKGVRPRRIVARQIGKPGRTLVRRLRSPNACHVLYSPIEAALPDVKYRSAPRVSGTFASIVIAA